MLTMSDAHDVWLLGVPGKNAGLLMLMVFGSLGVPRRNAGLLMLMMFGFFWGALQKCRLADALGAPQKRRLADVYDAWVLGGARQKRKLADAHDVWLLGVPAETQAC